MYTQKSLYYYNQIITALLFSSGNCTHGELRLANGTMYEGRLEACIDGIWGTVTDDIFSDFEARIACSQLGFSRRCKFKIKWVFLLSILIPQFSCSTQGQCRLWSRF